MSSQDTIQELKSTIQGYENHIKKNGFTRQVAEAYYKAVFWSVEKGIERGLILRVSKRAKQVIEQYAVDKLNKTIWEVEKQCQNSNTGYDLLDFYYEILKEESYHLFESFIFYMEKKRAWKKRFYQPRKKTLGVVVQDLQDLEDRVIQFLGVSQPSRTGKSTLCLIFLAWIALKRPNSHSAMGGHSGILAKGFYKELLNFMDTEEYTFGELYSYWHPGSAIIRDRSADDYFITLDMPDRFATITCRGIDGTWTGAVDVSADGYLYVDDLVRDREHSLSPTRMENTFQEYLNKMVDRKNDGARELMVGTLWNVMDPLERLRKMYEGLPGYRFRRIPALDENDESNFDYEINGFSTEYYRNMRERLDPPEWWAKYMQQPYVREGILFQADELRYFNGILPEADHRIVAVTDVALGGGDSLSMPIGAEYENGDVYIFDWVFNRGPKEVTLPIVVGKIIGNEIRQTRFEANVGGDLYCAKVEELLLDQNYKCSCTHKRAPNKIEKKAKIIAYSGDVKRKFIFLQAKKPTPEERELDAKLGIVRYERDKEYQAAMDEFTTFVTIGDNEHEDAADGITQLAMFVENPDNTARVEAVSNPYRTGVYGYGE